MGLRGVFGTSQGRFVKGSWEVFRQVVGTCLGLFGRLLGSLLGHLLEDEFAHDDFCSCCFLSYTKKKKQSPWALGSRKGFWL